MERRIINPWTWQDQYGFVQASEVSGGQRVLYCAGQVSVDAEGKPVHAGDMRAQVEDGGTTWKKIKNPAEALKLTLYKIVTRESNLWAVGEKGTYLHSADKGITWDLRPDATNTKFWLRDMDFCHALNGWAVGSRGTIIKTKDGGKTWNMLSGILVKHN